MLATTIENSTCRTCVWCVRPGNRPVSGPLIQCGKPTRLGGERKECRSAAAIATSRLPATMPASDTEPATPASTPGARRAAVPAGAGSATSVCTRPGASVESNPVMASFYPWTR
jgi:hypothetical protein